MRGTLSLMIVACGWGCSNLPTPEQQKSISSDMHSALTSTPMFKRVVKRQCNYGCYSANGGVQCWGDNSYGELGNGTTTKSDTPVLIPTLTIGVTDLVLGDRFACAVTTSGVTCWGDGYGPTPTAISGITTGVTKIVAGDAHACAIVNGNTMCWGQNGSGQLGDGTQVSRQTTAQTVLVSSHDGVTTDLAAGSTSTCGVAAHKLKCWGQIRTDQNGASPVITKSNVPMVMIGSGVTGVRAANDYTCATALGRTTCWGSTLDAAQSTTPVVACGTLGPDPKVTRQYVTLMMQ